MALKLDVQGSRFSQSVISDSTYTRRYVLTNIQGANAVEWIRNTLAALPASGDQLDTVAPLDTLFLVSADIDRIECDSDNGSGNPGDPTYRAVSYGSLEYATVDQTQAQNPDPDDNGTPVITSGSSVETITTWTDRDGNPILVPPPASQSAEDSQPAAVQQDVPTSIRTFNRRETSDPSLRSDVYVGRVNSLTWTIVGKPSIQPGYAKCNRIIGTSRDGGASYDVNYEFAIMDSAKPGGWQPEVAWIDPQTNKPDPSSTVGDGIIISNQYAEADFNALNLG